jgi:hypothetical protein
MRNHPHKVMPHFEGEMRESERIAISLIQIRYRSDDTRLGEAMKQATAGATRLPQSISF